MGMLSPLMHEQRLLTDREAAKAGLVHPYFPAYRERWIQGEGTPEVRGLLMQLPEPGQDQWDTVPGGKPGSILLDEYMMKLRKLLRDTWSTPMTDPRILRQRGSELMDNKPSAQAVPGDNYVERLKR